MFTDLTQCLSFLNRNSHPSITVVLCSAGREKAIKIGNGLFDLVRPSTPFSSSTAYSDGLPDFLLQHIDITDAAVSTDSKAVYYRLSLSLTLEY